jgi:hypothetical protein
MSFALKARASPHRRNSLVVDVLGKARTFHPLPVEVIFLTAGDMTGFCESVRFL